MEKKIQINDFKNNGSYFRIKGHRKTFPIKILTVATILENVAPIEELFPQKSVIITCNIMLSISRKLQVAY